VKQLFLTAGFALCGVSSPAQGIVWNWVPNSHSNLIFDKPIGDAVYLRPDPYFDSRSIDMLGNGTVDFQLQATALDGGQSIQVLPSAENAVLSIADLPPSISNGGQAVLLTNGNQVSSLNPVGVWLDAINGWPAALGSFLVGGFPEVGYGGQFVNQRGYVGVEFYAADGLHYGALDVAGATNLLAGILYGYGYNPVPNQPFDLSLVPLAPAPLAAPQIARPGNLRLKGQSQPGQPYQVQFKDHLDAPCWSNLDPTIIATSTNTLADVPIVGAARFYRVNQVQTKATLIPPQITSIQPIAGAHFTLLGCLS